MLNISVFRGENILNPDSDTMNILHWILHMLVHSKMDLDPESKNVRQ